MRVTTPEGSIIAYGYDATGRLSQATYPDGTSRLYLYEDSRWPLALTGLVDEGGVRFASWRYDEQGRAISSEHAGVARHSLSYQADGSVYVTDPLGTTRIQAWSTAGARKLFAGQNLPCASCTGDAARQIFDATTGLLTQRVDHMGVSSAMSWDAVRRLPLATTEAEGRPESRTVQVQWHERWRLPVLVTEAGRSTARAYDDMGNLIGETITDTANGQPRQRSWTYDARGHVQTHTDARGGVWRYSHDQAGNLASLTDPLARTTRWTHDAAGRVLTQTDPGGLVTGMAYDARRRLLSVSRAGETTRYTYTPVGLLASVQQADGYQVSYRHDAAHRLTGATDNRGASVDFTLDAMGNHIREEVKDASGQIARVSARVMNAMNRVAALQGASGQSTQWTYDANGELVAETDPLNQTTRRVLDGLGRPTALGFADNASALFAWNALDQLMQVTDPRSVRTGYQRNASGEELAETSPDIGQLRYQRDADGNVVQVQDARGDTTRIERDALGRVTRITYAPDLITQIGYDDAGNVSRVLDGSGSTDYVRDGLGRVLSRTQVVNDNPSNPSRYAMAYTWSGGQLAGMAYPSGLQVFYERSAGRITGISVQEPGRGKAVLPFITDLTHTALGQPRAWHWASGDNASRRFDADGRMVANDFATYAYDAAGRITGITQRLWARQKHDAAFQLPFTWTVGYDSRNRLTGFVREGVEAHYTYDANGNRLTSVENISGDADLDEDDKDADVSTTQVMQMDPGSNRLLGLSRSTTSVQHGRTHTVSTPVVHTLDANGALVNDGLRRFEYDASRRLSRVRIFQQGDEVAVRYLHNALGQRVFKSDTEDLDLRPPERNLGGGFLEWLLGRLQFLFIGAPSTSSLGTAYVYGEGPIPEWALLGEYGNGSAKARGRTEYLWLPTEDGGAIPVGLYREGRFYAVHTDHLGTPRLVTGEGGEPVWQWMYSAFGEGEPTGVLRAKSIGKPRAGDKPQLSKTEPAVELNLRFAGQYADEETGLFYNMLRSYNAANGGRYRQPDPIGLDGGWNRFSYVRNNPLSSVDPLGMWDWAFGAGFHFWAMPAPGAAGMNFASMWKPGGGVSDATADQAGEMVWGGVADIGVNAGLTNLSSCPDGTPTSLNLGFGRYGGVQIGFKNGQFDGVSLGLGIGISSPVTYTGPVTPKKR